jgi:Fungal cellulose binding domain
MKTSLICFCTGLATASANVCGVTYSQCGGIEFKGPACCSTVSKCVFVSDYYSQCMPVDFSDSDCAKVFDQCGGEGFTGPTCCTFDSECSVDGKFYSQCLPLPEVDAVAPSATPTATPTVAPTVSPTVAPSCSPVGDTTEKQYFR